VEEREPGTLSAAEFAAALGLLSIEDLGRLESVARSLALGSGHGAEDLLQEAICRTLDGGRSCPRSVQPVVFLYNAMRSIASAWRETLAGQGDHVSLDADVDGVAVQVAAPDRTVEQVLVARADYVEGVETLQRLFEDDGPALMVVMGMLDGVEGAELAALADLDEKGLATVRRRIRRKIEKAFPEGWVP